ncbi:MAG: NACHT domain-containing protein, partial [Chloroflexi bacterium]|nr:NACHT domain-containing protein [Chloroflexota bacterium]
MPETTVLYKRIRSLATQRQHNLPVQATPFVGRERELAELSRQLANPACRLLTLTGPGGIGKTRLALKVAEEQARTGYFLDGVYYVALAALSSANFLVSTLATVLNFTFYSNKDPQLQLLNYLRDKEMLLILDSFEHLLTPSWEGGLLIEIVQRAAGVKLLVTSQQRLNLQGEWVFEIQGLSFPEVGEAALSQPATPPAEPPEHYSAVQLFLQSAQRVQAGFTLSSVDQPFILRICQLVAGVPLGIELAAAWVRVLSCQDIVREIEQGLDFLSVTHRDLPERQQSLRAVFEHSWRLLSEAEQHILKKLAVFPGGFRREAAEQVAQARLPLLTALSDKSLLRWSAANQNQPIERYEIHELVRQYVLEKLQVDPAATTLGCNQHSAYFAAFLQQREARLQGRQQKVALAEIGQEIENIRAAWGWLLSQPKVAAIEQCLNTLFLFYEIRGWYEEGTDIFAHAAVALSALVTEPVDSDRSAG